MSKKEIEFMEQIVAKIILEKRETENKIYILNDKYNNPGWAPDRNYLNYEIGQSKIKLSHLEYVQNLLEVRIKKMKQKDKNVVEQFCFKP